MSTTLVRLTTAPLHPHFSRGLCENEHCASVGFGGYDGHEYYDSAEQHAELYPTTAVDLRDGDVIETAPGVRRTVQSAKPGTHFAEDVVKVKFVGLRGVFNYRLDKPVAIYRPELPMTVSTATA